jgi:hypothetical protein
LGQSRYVTENPERFLSGAKRRSKIFWRTLIFIPINKSVTTLLLIENQTQKGFFTAIADQTSHKKNFESVASQRFQNFSWLGFEREAL